MSAAPELGSLVVVLGDQLSLDSPALRDFDPSCDQVWMCEAVEESTKVWSHQARIAIFLAAMRHFAAALRERGVPVHYRELGAHPETKLSEALASDLERFRPARIVLVEPGEWAIARTIAEVAATAGVPVEVRPDDHFLCSTEEFAGWLNGRKQPRMEHFYRWMRQRTGWLMEGTDPAGGKWNYDADNRESFKAEGPALPQPPLAFVPDPRTREVLELVAARFADHPGSLEHFDWPVTREQALAVLDDFVAQRLPSFGRYQDALWAEVPWPRTLLFHSRVSAALNLKLLDPREVCEAAIEAWQQGAAPLAAVEGFVRQILGWREYVRGLYWAGMPGFETANALEASEPLPDFYWTAETEYACLRSTIQETLDHGYAHHIQRLMVTGLFGLLLGVDPAALHRWYLAVYVDAVEWVELPNTIGMSQYADGGWLASKPYIASGKYLQRMSNYCRGCRFDPAVATGPDACPFTTLYWDFLARHEERFANHGRMKPQFLNLARKDGEEVASIRQAADDLRRELRSLGGPRS